MDNLPKENSTEEKPTDTSGEIFNSPESAYQQATEVPQEQPAEGAIEPENIETQIQSPPLEDIPPPSDNIPPPPPYVEDNRKKYFIIIGAFIVILLLIFLVIRLFLQKQQKPPPNITLTYWGLWEDKELIQPIFDDYKRLHPNITINYIKQDPKQYRERLTAAIERGESPDIYRFHNTWIPMMFQYLTPIPKNIYSDAEFEKTFYPVIASDLKVGGNYYGIPLEIDGLLLFYNEDILKSASVAVPSTWDDVQNIAPKLTVKEKGRIITSAIALGTAENIEHFSDILGLMMLQNGTKLTQSFFSCVDKTSTTCAQETLSFYRKFAETPNNTWDDTLDNSIIAFASGRVAMVIAPSWQAHIIQEIVKNTKLNFKTAPVPQLPCEKPPCPSVNWATYWVEGVSNKTKNAQESWDLLKYLSQSDTMQKLYAQQIKYRKLFGEPYSRVDLGKSLSDNPYLAPLITSAPTMKSFYFAARTNDGETGIDSSLIKYLKDMVNSLSQGVSVETALKTADNGLKQVFTRFNISTSAQ